MAIQPTRPWPRLNAAPAADAEPVAFLPDCAPAAPKLRGCPCEEHDYCDAACLCGGVARLPELL